MGRRFTLARPVPSRWTTLRQGAMAPRAAARMPEGTLGNRLDILDCIGGSGASAGGGRLLGQPVELPPASADDLGPNGDVAALLQSADQDAERLGVDLHPLQEHAVRELAAGRVPQLAQELEAFGVEGILGHVGLGHEEHAAGLVDGEAASPGRRVAPDLGAHVVLADRIDQGKLARVLGDSPPQRRPGGIAEVFGSGVLELGFTSRLVENDSGCLCLRYNQGLGVPVLQIPRPGLEVRPPSRRLQNPLRNGMDSRSLPM